MTPERWQQINKIFQVAMDMDLRGRGSFLDESCSGDLGLRREVESLLESADHVWDLIEKPALEVGAHLLAEDWPQLPPGQEIGHYKVVNLIGRGGMGEVYLAEDRKLNRRIAVKLLSLDYANDNHRLDRFQREAQAASALNHPNILTIHELGEVDGKLFIATEFVDGQTLRERMKRSRLSQSEALDVAIQVTSALAAAHQTGIVHRDIKPENIMLRVDGLVKVLDFGLAKLLHANEFAPTPLNDVDVLHSSSLVMGTVKYMSPEQATGQPVDQRSDIFSLGVLLYEMLFGRLPFNGKTTREFFDSILNEEPSLPEDGSNNLNIVIGRCLSKNRDERYESALALLSDLKKLGKEIEPEVLIDAQQERAGAVPELPSSRRMEGASFQSEVSRKVRLRLIAFTAVIVVILATGFGLYRFVGRDEVKTPFQSIAITKFTNFGDAWAPSISPDGKYVVYAKNNVGPVKDQAQFTLWKRAVGTANEVELLPPTFGRVYHTSFAPDGERVYFAVGAGARIQLFMISSKGGTPIKILEDAFPVGISPDSNSIAYLEAIENEGKTSLIIANADGTSKREIITRHNSSYLQRSERPSWSPDGKRIACVGQDRDKSFPHVFVVDLDTRTEKTITSQKWTEIRGLSWVPDMSGLLLVAAEETSSIPQIWHISYPDGAARRITNDTVNYSRLDLTVNGDTVVTTAGEILSSVWVMPVENGQRGSSAPLSVDVSKARQISSLTLTSRDDLNNVYERLSWTPDGRIVYMSKESGNADIWSMNSEGGDHRQLTNDPHSDADSVVSPDGRYIAFVSNRSGSENIWIMEAEGGNQRRLTNHLFERSPEFSADGKWVFFNSWESGKATVWKVAVDGGQPMIVLPFTSFFPSISREGDMLAYIDDRGPSGREQVSVTPSAGGSPLISFKGNIGLSWLPTGKGLSYPWNGPIEGQPDRQTFNIWEQLLDGGHPRQLTKFAEPIFVHAWSRDGKTLAVLTAKYTSDVVLISDVR